MDSLASEISPNSCSDLCIINIKLKLETTVFYVCRNKGMSMESSFVPSAIPKFDGYYDHWAMLR